MKTKASLFIAMLVLAATFGAGSAFAQSVIKARPLQIFSPAGGNLTIQGPATITPYTLTMPGVGPSANQILMSDALGNYSWAGPFLPLTGGTLTGALSGTTFTGTSFTGDGSALTNLNASALSSGTIPAARMPALTGDVTSSAGSTTTALSTTGVTAGAYTSANITVDAKGRITAAANGSGGGGAGVGVYDNNNVRLGTFYGFNYNGTVYTVTSAGYVVNIYLDPNGTDNFPTDQIYWTGASCTGTPYYNDGGITGSKGYYKVLVYSHSSGSLYSLANPNANGISTSVAFTSGGYLENPTCMSGYPIAESGWALTAVSRSTVGLPATIAYPLSIH